LTAHLPSQQARMSSQPEKTPPTTTTTNPADRNTPTDPKSVPTNLSIAVKHECPWRNSSSPVLVNGGPAALHSPGLLLLLKMASETDPLPDGLKTQINTVCLHTDGKTTPQIRSEMLKTVVFYTSVFGLWGDDHVVVVAVIFLSLPSSSDVRFAAESFF
ncbi:hypothetical protein M9458_030493, partial [Cirrhinus mrigala]